MTIDGSLRRLLRRVLDVLRRDRLVRDIDDELRAHIELEAESLRRQGIEAAEARRLAGVSFGGYDATVECVRARHGLPRIEALVREVRGAARALRRAPVFAVSAMGVLALGVGGGTAAYGIARAVILRPLPYADEARMLSVYEADSSGARRHPSWPTVREWSAGATTFEALAWVRGQTLGVRADEGTLLLLAAYSTADLFRVMRVQPALGRSFDDAETHAGEPVVVLAWHLWRDQFGRDPGVVGRTLSTEVGPFTVIGVMPEGVRYPVWADLWLPQGTLKGMERAAIERRDLHVDAQAVGRLASGVDIARAEAELEALNARAAAVHPDARGWADVMLRPVRAELLGSAGGAVWLLAGATALLLLVACVNVAGLLVARSAARGRELAVRVALGASRHRLAGQLLAESAVLALGGGLLGVLLAFGLLRTLATRAATALPRLESVHVDAPVLAFALVLSALTALLFGALPARRAGAVAPMDALRSARGATAGPISERVRATLVVAEIALAAVLVVGAMSLARALLARTGADLGFDPSAIATLRVIPPARYSTAESARALYERLDEEVARVPGVHAVSLVNHLPLTGTSMPTDVRTTRVPRPAERPAALYRAISANYFATLGIGLVEGRALTDQDVAARAPVALVNESFARREWPDASAPGRSISVRRVAQGRPDFGQEMTLTVVGVVRDTRSFGPDAPEPPVVYAPHTLVVWTSMFIAVEAAPGRRAADIVDGVRDAIRRIDPAIPVAGPGFTSRVRPMTDYASNLFATRRLNTTLVSGFAGAALALAAVGLFGVIAWSVIQRRREFGVRVALGASSRDISALVVREGIRLVAFGTAIGFAAAAGLGHALRATVPDLAGMHLATWALAASIFAVVGLFASVLPALRAARIAPGRILREEG